MKMLSRMITAALVTVTMVALCANEGQAQNWRRQSTGSYPQRSAPRVDSSASSDQHRPGGSYVDPSASSDQFRPYVPPYYPPQPQYYPPYYPPQQPTYPQYVPPQTPYVDPLAQSDPYPPARQRHYLGVRHQPSWEGAYITSVVYGSPAFRVGIEPGDVLISMDGVSLANQDLRRAISLSDGFVELVIRDRRTNRLVQRNVDLRN